MNNSVIIGTVLVGICINVCIIIYQRNKPNVAITENHFISTHNDIGRIVTVSADDTLQFSGVKCDEEGGIICDSIRVKNLILDDGSDSRQILTLDNTRVKGLPIEDFYLGNSHVRNNRMGGLAIFEDDKIIPCKYGINLTNVNDGDLLEMKDDDIIASSSAKFVKINDVTSAGLEISGQIARFDDSSNMLLISDESIVLDVQNLVNSPDNSLLMVNNKHIVTDDKKYVYLTTNYTNDDYSESLAMFSEQEEELVPSKVSFNFSNAKDGQVLIYRQNDNTARFEDFLQYDGTREHHLLTYDPVSKLFAQSPYYMDIENDDNIGKILGFDNSEYGISAIEQQQFVTMTNDVAQESSILVYDKMGRVKPLSLKLNYDKTLAKVGQVLTLGADETLSLVDAVEKAPKDQDGDVILLESIGGDTNKHYLPIVIEGDQSRYKLTSSSLYVENNDTLVIPSGKIKIGQTLLDLSAFDKHDGMLIYDGTEFRTFPEPQLVVTENRNIVDIQNTWTNLLNYSFHNDNSTTIDLLANVSAVWPSLLLDPPAVIFRIKVTRGAKHWESDVQMQVPYIKYTRRHFSVTPITTLTLHLSNCTSFLHTITLEGKCDSNGEMKCNVPKTYYSNDPEFPDLFSTLKITTI